MAKIEEVQQFLQQLAPASLAAPWDNVGVLVDCAADVTSILVSLDITDEVVAEAEIQGCQLIVAHHPVIFKPMSRIGRGDVPFRMIKKNISALCAHTNLDAAEGGVNDILCKLFGVGSARPFGEGNLGRVGQVRTVGAAQLAAQCKATLNAPGVKLVDTGRPIATLAPCAACDSARRRVTRRPWGQERSRPQRFWPMSFVSTAPKPTREAASGLTRTAFLLWTGTIGGRSTRTWSAGSRYRART